MTLLIPIVSILVLLGQAQAADTTTARIYQWSDKDGQVQFSDRPPPNGNAPDKVTSRPAATGPDAGDDTYSVENQARRMEADRRQRKEQRLRAEHDRWEMRQRELEERRRIAELEAAEARGQWEMDEANRSVYPGYGYRIDRRPGCCRPGGGHRPGRPVHPIHPIHPIDPIRPGRPAPRGLTPRTHINSPIGAGALWRAPRR